MDVHGYGAISDVSYIAGRRATSTRGGRRSGEVILIEDYNFA